VEIDELRQLIAERRRMLNRRKFHPRSYLLGLSLDEENPPERALVLQPPHGQKAVEGEKIVLISDRALKHANENLYLVEDGKIYGIVRFGEEELWKEAQLSETENEHGILPQERKVRWPDCSQFHAYKLFLVQDFPQPVRVKRTDGPYPAITDDIW